MPPAKPSAPRPSQAAARARQPKPPRPFTKAEVEEFYRRLAASRPIPQTELEFINPFTLLVAVVLSAQATDVGVNKATPALFAVADTPQKMLGARRGAGRRNSSARSGSSAPRRSNIIALSPDPGRRAWRRGAARPRGARNAAGGRAQDRQCRAQRRVRRADDRGRHAYLPRRQPHRPRARQDAARGRDRARSRHAGRVQARRASLADPARPLCLQGAQSPSARSASLPTCAATATRPRRPSWSPSGRRPLPPSRCARRSAAAQRGPRNKQSVAPPATLRPAR